MTPRRQQQEKQQRRLWRRENSVSEVDKIRNPDRSKLDIMGTSCTGIQFLTRGMETETKRQTTTNQNSDGTSSPANEKKLYGNWHSTFTRRRCCSKNILGTTLLFIIFVFTQIHPSDGGTCWLNVNKNGKCTALIQMGSTKEDCCGNGILAKSATAAYSEGELSSSGIFIMHIQGGVQCTRCKETCDNVKCPENKKCTLKKGHPKCVCSPNCAAYRLQHGLTTSRGAVCGTDGETYKNVCRLLKRSCRQKLLISVAYAGPCKATCSSLHCPDSKQCLVDQNMIPHCVNCSERKCLHQHSVAKDRKQKLVCGLDGVTYPSICHLRQASCHQGKAIPIAYAGPCKKKASCETVHCLDGQKCLTGVVSGQPRCVTCSRKRWCKKYQRHQVKGPICSNNGKTYKNWCDMMDDACSSGYALETKHFGQCKASDRLKNDLPV